MKSRILVSSILGFVFASILVLAIGWMSPRSLEEARFNNIKIGMNQERVAELLARDFPDATFKPWPVLGRFSSGYSHSCFDYRFELRFNKEGVLQSKSFQPRNAWGLLRRFLEARH